MPKDEGEAERLQSIHKLEQASATIVEQIVPIWASMRRKLIEEGMPPEDAMSCVRVYIFSMGDRKGSVS